MLFTDADTRHTPRSVATGLRDAQEHGAALLSYSPKQEVHGLAERALMPLIFAELAASYRPKDVSDPNSAIAAANGQYLLIRRDAYEQVGGHAAIAHVLLEDVGLAKLVKRAGYRLYFAYSEAVSTRMYRTARQLWEGWTRTLALVFANPREIAFRRSLEFLGLVAGIWVRLAAGYLAGSVGALVALVVLFFFFRRVRRAHFDWLSNVLAIFGLPVFAVLLLRSYVSHKRGSVRWKGRTYGTVAPIQEIREHGLLNS